MALTGWRSVANSGNEIVVKMGNLGQLSNQNAIAPYISGGRGAAESPSIEVPPTTAASSELLFQSNLRSISALCSTYLGSHLPSLHLFRGIPLELGCMAGIWQTILGVSPWIIGPMIPLILGGNSIIFRRAFQQGMTVAVFLFYKNLLASLTLASAALVTRTERPPLGWIGALRVLHLAILEPLVSQFCIFTGLRYTSASFSSSMAACGPALTFIAACFFGMEYVHWTARSFQAKVLGMILMVGGGCIVGFYHGSSINIMHTSIGTRFGRTERELREDWFRGPLLVLVSLAASVWYNLQIKKVAEQVGPAIWLSFYIFVLGTAMTVLVALGLEGVVVSGLASFIQITLTRMRDPVFVAAFSSISLIFVTVMSLLTLRDVIHMGSILGAICIMFGLLMLLWGKAHDPTPLVLPVQEMTYVPRSSPSAVPSLQPLSSPQLEAGEPDVPEPEARELRLHSQGR